MKSAVDFVSEENIENTVKEIVTNAEQALSYYGGVPGKVAAEVVDAIDLLAEGDLAKLFDEGLEKIPNVVNTLTLGFVSKEQTAGMIQKVLDNKTIMSALENAMKALSYAINTFIIKPIKAGVDFSLKNIEKLLDKMGPLTKPVTDVLVALNESLDKILDTVQKNVSDAYLAIGESAEKFKEHFQNIKETTKQIVAESALGVIHNTIKGKISSQNQYKKPEMIEMKELKTKAADILNDANTKNQDVALSTTEPSKGQMRAR